MSHEAGIDGGNGNGFMVRAICVSSGGEMILRCLRSALGGGERVNIDDIPGRDDEKEISDFALWSLFDDDKACWNMCVLQLLLHEIFTHTPSTSGQAVGIGAKREVVAWLIQRAVSDPKLCKAVNSEVYYSLATRKAPLSKDQNLELRVLGFCCMLYIFTFHLFPDPISPALVQFCIGGLKSVIDIDFIRAFAPETAVKLHVWPLDHSVPLDLRLCQDANGQPTVANLALEHLDMMVS